jgi:hypothetical protein
MRYAFICALLAGLIAGCSSGPEAMGEGPQPLGTTNAPAPGPWSKYIQVMTERERLEFLNILEDKERKLWLARKGIDVRAELADRLSRGISVEAAKRRISDPLDHEDKRGNETMLYYSRYNTESRTNYYLTFRSDQLTNWNTYTLAEQQRTLGLITFENELMRKFDAYLKVDMGPGAIRSLGVQAKKNLDNTQLALRERISDPNYKGPVEVVVENGPDGKPRNVAKRGGSRETVYHHPYYEDERRGAEVEEQIELARGKSELLSWFDREPDYKIIHRPFETHQFFLTYKSMRGEIETVTVEFVYRDGLLKEWYVYHEE